MAICCVSALACTGDVRPGLPIDEDDSGATIGDAQVSARDAARADADAGTSKTESDARTSVDAAREAAADTGSAGGPVDSGSGGGGAQDSGASAPAQDAQPADTGGSNGNRLAVFVAVGYSGIRMVSRDLGRTWGDAVTSGGSGDDANLLRSVGYGNGVFAAIGSKIWTSTDAVNWTERTSPANGQWFGGIEYGNGVFVAAGGYGASIYSSDGLSWTSASMRNTDAARSLAFGDGTFIAATDSSSNRKWWSTSDGRTWSVMSEGHASDQVVWCKDHFSDATACTGPEGHNGSEARTAFGEGVYVSVSYSKIERSENGVDWTTVTGSPQAPLTDVAFGYIPQ